MNRMDNKKAIALLSMIEFEHAECCLNTWYKGIDDDMKEAIETAIEALEKQDKTEKLLSVGVLKDCKSCKFEKTGNNSTYPCSHCSRCYTDKYKAKSEDV